MNNRWTCSNTSVFNINYHLIWCTKYRRPLLSDDIESRLKTLLAEKAAELSITIKALEVMPDHVHIFVHTSPLYSAHMIVQGLYIPDPEKRIPLSPEPCPYLMDKKLLCGIGWSYIRSSHQEIY